MATDALAKAIDTYHAYMADIAERATETAKRLEAKPATVNIPKPDTRKGQG